MSDQIKKPAFIFFAVLALVGIGCWVFQLVTGLGITGMSNTNSWGLYIIMFMFFVGLSAGGLIVASSASVFHIAKYKKVSIIAVITSTVCICVAGMFVLVDLGGIQKVWRILTGPNFASPLFWDICVITCYLAINIVYLVLMASKKPGASDKVAIVSRFALPVAILVHSVTAWIFGLQIAKEGWFTAILAPIFVASALDSGLALLVIVLAGLNKTGRFKTEKSLLASLAGLLCVCIAVDAYFIGCEVLTMGYPGAEGLDTLAVMTTGATAPFFWFEVVFGLAVPFCILVFAKNRANMKLVIVSCALVVFGVLCKRCWLLLTSFAAPNITGGPGTPLGTFAAQEGGLGMWSVYGSYAPTIPEILIAVGVISVGVLGFMALCQKLLPGDSGSAREENACVTSESSPR